MFINTEETNNPNVLKFVFGFIINYGDQIGFDSDSDFTQYPLVKDLFTISGVISVFIDKNHISIGKEDACNWAFLKPQIVSILLDYGLSGENIFDAKKDNEYGSFELNENDPIIIKITEIIDDRIRPAIKMDGGELVLIGFKDGIVYVSMQGACDGCPYSETTLKYGIEKTLTHYIPEVTKVINVG